MKNKNKSIKSKEQKTPNESKIQNTQKESTTLKGISTIIKRDTLPNWQKAVNYIPNSNVLIVIDNPDGSSDIKLGNGKDKVNELEILISGKVDIKIPKVDEDEGVLML